MAGKKFNHRLFWTNLVVLAVLVVITALIEIFAQPQKITFFCNDISIGYPYRDSTVGVVQLFSLIFGIPLLTFIVVELLIIKLGTEDVSICYQGATILCLFVNLFFGATLSGILVESAKFIFGRLRPNFLDVCRPDFSQIDCGTAIKPRPVIEYECLGNPDLVERGLQHKMERGAYLSFFSGHAILSFYTLVHTALYLQARFDKGSKSRANIVVPSAQILMVAVAIYISGSRLLDNKHHLSDIFIGAVLGIFLAVWNVRYVLKLFDTEAWKPLPTFYHDYPPDSETESLLLREGRSKNYRSIDQNY